MVECFARFGIGRSRGAAPKSCSEGQWLVDFPPAPEDNFCGFFFVVRKARLDNTVSSASSFGFFVGEFINLNALVAWDPGYVYVGVVVSL